MDRGLFITVEGPDGSGKSTLIKNITNWLSKHKYPFIGTKEPGSPLDPVCQKIRKIVLDPENKISGQTESFLMMADRCNHVSNVILPNLNNGTIVISDRYIDSTYAYQGWGREHGNPEKLALVNELNKITTNYLIPDVTIMVMVDTKVGLERAAAIKEFDSPDRMESEKIDFHKRVSKGFKEVVKLQKDFRTFIVVDSTKKTEQEIFEKVIKRLHKIVSRYYF